MAFSCHDRGNYLILGSAISKTSVMRITRFFFIGIAAISFFLLTACQQQPATPKAKYVFLFIGDGMGVAQVNATEAYLGSLNANTYQILNFREFPHTGLSTTYAATRFITGSAAAGTALATGSKTAIGRISMDVAGDSALETIAEKAKKLDMKVGIISSVSLDHATPAAFYAHQKNRGMYHEIGLDLAQSDVDFFGGGGFRDPVRISGADTADVMALAMANGYNYVNDAGTFRALEPSAERVLFVNPALTDGASMMYAIDQPDDYVTLAEITRKAIRHLDNENGFFIMVEGGKIDWLCPANAPGAMVQEVVDLSEAVEEAIAFYRQHPDETLIIVTADHETGGLGLGTNLMEYDTDYSLLANQKMSGEAFNLMTAEWRKDNHINEKGFKMMLKLTEEYYGIGGEGAPIVLSEKERDAFEKAFMALDLSQEGEYSDYNMLTYLCSETLSQHAGMGWTSSAHTGVCVPVYSIGLNSEAFTGSVDNTDIPRIIMETID